MSNQRQSSRTGRDSGHAKVEPDRALDRRCLFLWLHRSGAIEGQVSSEPGTTRIDGSASRRGRGVAGWPVRQTELREGVMPRAGTVGHRLLESGCPVDAQLFILVSPVGLEPTTPRLKVMNLPASEASWSIPRHTSSSGISLIPLALLMMPRQIASRGILVGSPMLMPQ
jgi:hypothetical protein